MTIKQRKVLKRKPAPKKEHVPVVGDDFLELTQALAYIQKWCRETSKIIKKWYRS